MQCKSKFDPKKHNAIITLSCSHSICLKCLNKNKISNKENCIICAQNKKLLRQSRQRSSIQLIKPTINKSLENYKNISNPSSFDDYPPNSFNNMNPKCLSPFLVPSSSNFKRFSDIPDKRKNSHSPSRTNKSDQLNLSFKKTKTHKTPNFYESSKDIKNTTNNKIFSPKYQDEKEVSSSLISFNSLSKENINNNTEFIVDELNKNQNQDNNNINIINNKNNNNNNNQNVEYCPFHEDKEIELFCSTCSCTICSLCIYEGHNGHILNLLKDTANALKNNILDLNNIILGLKNFNFENQFNLKNKLLEIDEYKNNQILLIDRSFEEINKKIIDIKHSITEEFIKKFSQEILRFKKIQNYLENNLTEIKNIENVISEILKKFHSFSDAKILRRFKDYVIFLQRRSNDIKQLFKNEKLFKSEIIIDPLMKPIPINNFDLIQLLSAIDPKKICYPSFSAESNSAYYGGVNEDSNIMTGYNTNTQSGTQKNNNINNNSSSNLYQKSSGSNISNSQVFKYFQEKRFTDELNSYLRKINVNPDSDYGKNKSHSHSHSSNNNQRKQRDDDYYYHNYNNTYNNNYNNTYSNNYNNNNFINEPNYQKNKMYYNNQQEYSPENYEMNASEENNYNQKNSQNSQENSNNVKYSNNNINNSYSNNNSNKNVNNNSNQSQVNLPYIQNTNPNLKNNNNKKENENNNLYNIVKRSNEISIYCFGEDNCCLKFYLSSPKWEILPYTNDNSKNLGLYNNTALCALPDQIIIMTGGSHKITGEPSNKVFKIDTNNINEIKMMKTMKKSRYNHACIYLNNYIYCLGGYDNINKKNEITSTISSCEKYNIIKNKWQLIREMTHPRACFGKCIYNEQIFVFGGYCNKLLLSSIEKYEPYSDIWITFSIKLPKKIAEVGVINLDNKFILLLGGIDEDFSPTSKMYIGRFDHNITKDSSWVNGQDLICPRVTGSSAFYWNKNIYVVGGSIEGICEKYSMATKKWNMIESYNSIIDNNDTMLKKYSCELNYYIQPS